jgi:hypothetical protein
MLCKGDHYSHLCPCMDEGSSLLEKLQIPKGYHKISPNPSLVDGMVNLVPSPVSPVAQVVDLFSSLVDPTLPLESDTKMVDPFPPVNPILPLENETQVVDRVLSSVDPTPPLTSDKVVDPVPSSVSPTLPLKSACMVDSIPSSVDPTLPLESKPDIAHVFLVDTDSTMLGGIPHSPVKPPPSNESILFDWGVLAGPCLPSQIPFHIIVQVCG